MSFGARFDVLGLFSGLELRKVLVVLLRQIYLRILGSPIVNVVVYVVDIYI